MPVHSGKLTKTLFTTLQSWPSGILPHTESENDALQIKRITDGFGGREKEREKSTTNVPTSNTWSPGFTLYSVVCRQKRLVLQILAQLN